MKKNKINYIYISASENVNWLLNIRGKDLPNSPLVNCKLIITNYGKSFLLIDLNKVPKLIKKLYKNIIIYDENIFYHYN